jgi:hypothetical protein
MSHPQLNKLTALLLILEFILVSVPFFVLQAVFDFPDILRQPADTALRLFSQNSSTIIPTYYAFMLSGVLLIPLSVLVRQVLVRHNSSDSTLLNLATVFGIVTGIVQFLGFVRWPFMIPHLAETYLNPASSAATREAAVVVYESFNRYAGVAVGEHMGWLFLSLWTVLIAIAMLRSRQFKPWAGQAGIVIGIGILVSSLEQFGGSLAPFFGTINLLANVMWTFWLLVLAVFLLRARPVEVA